MLPLPSPVPEPRNARVPDAAHGLRVDRALAVVFADLADAGLRARRRLCERGAVRVNDRAAGAADRVRAGDVLSLAAFPAPGGVFCNTLPAAERPVLVCRTAHLAALYKPAGLHSAVVAGSPEPALEHLLPHLLDTAARTGRPDIAPTPEVPRLLNRLDRATSGLVLAACSATGRRLWENAENSGRIDKWYLAVLEGELRRPLRIRAALDTADRRKTRILSRDGADPLRRTEVAPLAAFAAATLFPGAHGNVTLAVCRIRKGARHQIRAHLASTGHPLAGDALYGSRLAPRSPAAPFLLHHACLHLPGFLAEHLPVWRALLPDAAEQAMRKAIGKHAADACNLPKRQGDDAVCPEQLRL